MHSIRRAPSQIQTCKTQKEFPGSKGEAKKGVTGDGEGQDKYTQAVGTDTILFSGGLICILACCRRRRCTSYFSQTIVALASFKDFSRSATTPFFVRTRSTRSSASRLIASLSFSFYLSSFARASFCFWSVLKALPTFSCCLTRLRYSLSRSWQLGQSSLSSASLFPIWCVGLQCQRFTFAFWLRL